jgi:ABC-type transporter Mla subunit MlaD
MSGAIGPDIAAVYQLLTQVARTLTGHGRKLDDRSTEVAAHDRKLDDLAAGLAPLRDAVTHYLSRVLGHGLLISKLDERVRRIERHLSLRIEPAGN